MPTHGKQQIYVIQHELGPVKIGIAKRPESRLTDLQVSCPFILEIRDTETPDNAAEVERYLHNRFGNYHMRGEWFDIPPEERDFGIPTRIKDSGRPDVRIETSPDRDMNNEWGELLERVFKTMRGTKYHTTPVKQIRELCRGLMNEETRPNPEESSVEERIEYDKIEEDITKGKIQCSNCGFLFDEASSGCPKCSADMHDTNPHEYGHDYRR